MRSVLRFPAVGAALLSSTVLLACNRQPDVKQQVAQSLEQANIDEVAVDYDTDARAVHLKGAVDTSAERQRAEEIAVSAVGTAGTVLNELTVKGMNDDTAGDLDGQIEDRLEEMVSNDQVLRDRNVDFDVNNGVVTVKGDVRTSSEKAKVDQFVKAAPGVKDFANELEVKPKQ
jgi:osmotically-inducible protein OsmY